MTTDCVHHYMIETPSGRTVAARCKHCGHERVYPTTKDSMEVAVNNDLVLTPRDPTALTFVAPRRRR